MLLQFDAVLSLEDVEVGSKFCRKKLYSGTRLIQTNTKGTRKCPNYLGVRIKRALEINVTDTCFNDTKAKTYNL